LKYIEALIPTHPPRLPSTCKTFTGCAAVTGDGLYLVPVTALWTLCLWQQPRPHVALGRTMVQADTGTPYRVGSVPGLLHMLWSLCPMLLIGITDFWRCTLCHIQREGWATCTAHCAPLSSSTHMCAVSRCLVSLCVCLPAYMASIPL